MSDERSERRGLTDHPGWFGFDYGGSGGSMILGIHADWPAYPCAPGGGHALLDLAQFPQGTRFFPIDDIDRCILFGAYNFDPKKPGRADDPMAPHAFQIAIWHEDLMLLQAENWISGVTPVCEREWEMRRRIEWGWPKRQLYTKLDDGTYEKIIMPPLPPVPDADDFSFGSPYEYPAFDDDEDGSEGAITVTAKGWETVTQQLAERLQVPESLPDLRKLLDGELYDHAARAIGVEVEEGLRRIVGNDDGFGQRLVGEFVNHLGTELFAYNTTLKIYQLRLRTFFKFVRNPHAHRKIVLARPQALALMTHGLELLGDIQAFRAGENEG
ncbi:hypothetical protein ACFC6L_19095 [Kitasatospora phosalacinea]|uniref:hypothetical protein n=1 Tax=Kitasatospora phosalacinea TaxID=2065 RepID=UPI0035D8252D